MQWKVYLLFSEKLRRTYTGCARDVYLRLTCHNSGKVYSTKYGFPWKLIYQEEVGSYKEARARERYYKNASGRKKISAILNGLERSHSPV